MSTQTAQGGQKKPRSISIIVTSLVAMSVLSAGYLWIVYQIIGL